MAVNLAPSAWFGSGYSLGTNQLIFNTANHATPVSNEVDNTAGNATTGDAREILYALINKAYKSYIAMAAADRPSKMTITRSTTEDSAGVISRTFYITFTLNPNTSEAVATES